MSRAGELSDAAALWLIRLEGQPTADLWQTFEEWLDRDPRHRAAFIRLRVAWNRVDRLKHLRPADGSIDADLLARNRISAAILQTCGPQPLPGVARRRRHDVTIAGRRRALAVAAAIATAGLAAWFGAHQLGWRSYETGIGARERIALADGSTVDLNTDTALSTRITASRREMALTRGEALFRVAHDPARPFYVTAGGAVIRATGTSFAVRISHPEDVEVVVGDGAVAVGPPGTDANFENPALLAAAARISALQAATVRRTGIVISNLGSQQLERRLAWTSGHLAFQGETLAFAVREFNRYNRRRLIIADPSLGMLQVGGVFLATDPDSFVAALRRSFGIHARVASDKGDIRLSSGEPPP